MKLSFLAIALVLLTSHCRRVEEPVVSVHEEPRHHLVHEDEVVRILDVQIQPGDTTLYHTHAAPIFYVAIAVSPTDVQPFGGEWEDVPGSEDPAWGSGDVAYNIDYADQPVTHRVRNVGDSLFRLIAVINKRSRPSETLAQHGIRLPGEVETDNEWFCQSRVTIAPRESVNLQHVDPPTAVVQSSQGSLEFLAHPDNRKLMASPGDFAVADPGHSLYVTNRGSSPATIVIISLR
jgi:quercetin dioxygenase-like cupin family protein